jgi:hypothetical protein
MRLANTVIPDPSRQPGEEKYAVYFHGEKQEQTFTTRAEADALLQRLKDSQPQESEQPETD